MQSPSQLRESAMVGAGPQFRGDSLLPSGIRYAMLERAGCSIFDPEIKPEQITIDDVLSLVFATTADRSLVIGAAHAMHESGYLYFDRAQWIAGIEKWEDSLDAPMTIEEIEAIRKSAILIAKQIDAAQFRAVKETRLESSDIDSGN